MKPNIRLLVWPEGLPSSAMLPSAANRTPAPEAEVIVLSKRRAWEPDSPAAANVTSANATRPDGAIWRAPRGAYGELTVATPGRPATRANRRSARARTSGAMTAP